MEFDEIIVKESPGLCRCCLSEGCYKDMGTEYAWMNENEVYADMLLECFDISISQLNDGPNGPNRLICEVCITRLRDACYFKKQVLESEKKFIDMVGRGEFKSKAILVSLANMKAETADDDDAASFGTDDADPEYLDDEIEYLEEDILKAETQEPGVSDVTADPLPVRGKRGRPRKDPVKADKKKVKTEPKPKSSKPALKGKRHNVSIGRHTKDAIRARRYRQLKSLEQSPKPRGRPKKVITEASKGPKTTTEIFKELPEVQTKKSRSQKLLSLSRVEKRAYQFAKPIIKATTNKTSYNLKVQQHLSLSDLGIATADESKTDDESDSSRKSILHHMKLAMRRVRLGKN